MAWERGVQVAAGRPVEVSFTRHLLLRTILFNGGQQVLFLVYALLDLAFDLLEYALLDVVEDRIDEIGLLLQVQTILPLRYLVDRNRHEVNFSHARVLALVDHLDEVVLLFSLFVKKRHAQVHERELRVRETV